MKKLKLIWAYIEYVALVFLKFSCLYYALYNTFWHSDTKLAMLYLAGAFIFSNEIETLKIKKLR
jgi:hypothetical protein